MSELLVELLGAAALLWALVSGLVVEPLGAAAELLLWEVALLCELMSELLVEEVELGGFAELLGAAVLLCPLILLWSEVVLAPVLPTPLELAACDGVAEDGGVF
jgi:hypothetical protein